MAFSRAKTFACPKKTPTVQVRTNQDLNVWSFQYFFFKHCIAVHLNLQVCISLTFPLFAMLFIISFDVLIGYVI